MKNKYTVSEVVATLIILVISVLLAGVVTYYAINLRCSRGFPGRKPFLKRRAYMA